MYVIGKIPNFPVHQFIAYMGKTDVANTILVKALEAGFQRATCDIVITSMEILIKKELGHHVLYVRSRVPQSQGTAF